MSDFLALMLAGAILAGGWAFIGILIGGLCGRTWRGFVIGALVGLLFLICLHERRLMRVKPEALTPIAAHEAVK